MEKYLIISDIDGTLSFDHQHVSAKTAAVLQQLLDAGHAFYAATGRMYNLAKIMTTQVDPRAEIIASNGAVYDFNGDRVHHLMGESALLAAEAAASAQALSAVYFTDDAVYYTQTPTQSVVDTLMMFANAAANIVVEQVHTVENLLAHAGEITNGLIFSPDAPEPLARTMMTLASQNVLHLSASDPTNIELIPKHIDKSTAIAELQAKTGIPASRTIVFGDGLNDLGMLQAAGVSVAMGNAVPEVKAAARYQTLANTEDGIAHFLSNFF
ncbi:MAG: Cof-type HAD-IIB family hydrolase [Lactobacillus sp.]|jgi:Cof subfamily protein (haloacid dehalogenase superfamily)|nr:Cof-type HAD-IIB family hydrolase [Lactobacillus sp.]MCI2032162.1 Cof-type HAD-IIB family hydrolase [Lactobacillus sp.]